MNPDEDRMSLSKVIFILAETQLYPGGGVHLSNGPPLRHGGEDGPGGDGGLRQRLREALGQLVQQPNGLSSHK